MVAEPKTEIAIASKLNCKFSVRQRLRIKTLLLVRGQTYSQIAKDDVVAMNETQVAGICRREGWHKERRRLDLAERKLIAQRTEEDLAEVRENIATECDELTFGGLDLARESLDKKDARSFAQAANGVRALATIARESRATGAEQVSGKAELNVFVFRVGDPVKAEPKQAEAIDIKAITQ